MLFSKKQVFFISIVIAFVFVLTGCGGQKQSSGSTDQAAPTKSVGEQVDYRIVGIDPGTGIMDKTDEAIKAYGLGDKWSVQSSSGPIMTAQLGKAIKNKEPIIVTGWKPHWKFSKYDLKFLDDPKKVYGEGNNVHTLIRLGLKDDLPGVYKFFDQFTWELSEEQEVMVMAEQDNMDAAEAARKWIDDHPDRVKAWTDGVEKGNGQKVSVTLVAWADAIATTNVVTEVLKDLGYEPKQIEVTINAMYAGLADGSADAMFASWLPAQQKYYDDYTGKYEDLGPNSKGTRIGLVVPAYMEDVNSIEDLKK